MVNILRDPSLPQDTRVGVLEVQYPDAGQWDVAAFQALVEQELAAIRAEGASYDRETWFRQDAFFRYFRKFKKTYPVMMQVESFLLKGRPFPEGRFVNAVAFLTELKTRGLIGTHDGDRVQGTIVYYQESAETPFPSIHGGEAHSYVGDVTGRDDGGVIISMIAGADDRTCLNEQSRHALYFAFGTPGMAPEVLQGYLEQLSAYAKTLAPTATMELRMI